VKKKGFTFLAHSVLTRHELDVMCFIETYGPKFIPFYSSWPVVGVVNMDSGTTLSQKRHCFGML